MAKKPKKHDIAACPCGNNKSYQNCCEPLHLGQPAANAEDLMRSRYTAYVMKLEHYLLKTWHIDTRPEQLDLEDSKIKWLGLRVTEYKVLSDSEAIVAFIAKYKVSGNRAEEMHEVSYFKRTDAWYYVSGDVD